MNSTLLPFYDTLISSIDDIERKGKKTPYTSMNGHMFSFITKEGALAIRLSPDDLSTFMEDQGGLECIQHGRIMKEYAVVPNRLIGNFDIISEYFGKSYQFVRTLKPKATKKKKKK